MSPFKRHSRLFRLFRIAFYLSLPAGMALLIVSQFTQLSTPQAIAAWALAAAATIIMAMPIVAGLTLLPGFSENLASKHRAQPPCWGRTCSDCNNTHRLRRRFSGDAGGGGCAAGTSGTSDSGGSRRHMQPCRAPCRAKGALRNPGQLPPEKRGPHSFGTVEGFE